MSFKEKVGMDAVDLAIQALVTLFLGVAVAAGASDPSEAELVVPIIVASSLVLFGFRRGRALRQMGRIGPTTGEVEAMRIEELEQRVADLEMINDRLTELEERVDFSERLLASGGGGDARPFAERDVGGPHAS
jgi:hypothetical protein